VNKNENIWKK